MELALKKGNKGLGGVDCPLKAHVNTKQAELCLNTQKANHIDWPFEHLKSKNSYWVFPNHFDVHQKGEKFMPLKEFVQGRADPTDELSFLLFLLIQ